MGVIFRGAAPPSSYSRSPFYALSVWLIFAIPTSAGEKKVPIRSQPSGAKVVLQGNWKICKSLSREGADGVTPCTFSVEEGAFYAEVPSWEDSKLLQVPLKITLSKDGYLPEEVELTRGPKYWEGNDATGHIKRTYYFLISRKFDIMLRPDPLVTGVKPEQLTTRPPSDPLKILTARDAIYDCKRFYDQDNPEKALHACNLAVALSPSGEQPVPDVYHYRCLSNYQLKRFEPALSDCLTLTRVQPTDIAWNNIGLIYQALGRHAEAVTSFTKALKLNQNYAKAFRNRGISYERLNRFLEALDDYTSTLKAAPGDTDALLLRAHLYNRNRNCQAAEIDSDAAAASTAKRAEALIERGDARVCQERYDAAISDYTAAIAANNEALRSDSARTASYIHRARARRLSRNFEGARRDLDAAEGLITSDKNTPASVRAELQAELSALAGNR